VGCYICYSEEGTGRGPSPSPPRPLLAVPNVTNQVLVRPFRNSIGNSVLEVFFYDDALYKSRLSICLSNKIALTVF